MVTQVPPLKLEYQTYTYDSDRHKVVEPRAAVRTGRYQGQKIYYLWPGLVDGGGRIISAGEVALQQYSWTTVSCAKLLKDFFSRTGCDATGSWI